MRSWKGTLGEGSKIQVFRSIPHLNILKNFNTFLCPRTETPNLNNYLKNDSNNYTLEFVSRFIFLPQMNNFVSNWLQCLQRTELKLRWHCIHYSVY